MGTWAWNDECGVAMRRVHSILRGTGHFAAATFKGGESVRLRYVLLSQRVWLAAPSVCAAWEAPPPRAHVANGAEHTICRRLQPRACKLPAALRARTVGLCTLVRA